MKKAILNEFFRRQIRGFGKDLLNVCRVLLRIERVRLAECYSAIPRRREDKEDLSSGLP